MRTDCALVRELAPEMALEILSDRRDQVLAHLHDCSDCREHLVALTRSADGVLALAPAITPPDGFSERVLTAIRRPRHRSPLISWAALVLAAAALAGGSVWLAGAHDRSLAREYAGTLQVLRGKSLQGAELKTPSGLAVGQAIVYEGRPSWLFVVIEGGLKDGDYTVELRDDKSKLANQIIVAGGRATLGIRLPTVDADRWTVRVLSEGKTAASGRYLEPGR